MCEKTPKDKLISASVIRVEVGVNINSVLNI
jgi:hypothetical protein